MKKFRDNSQRAITDRGLIEAGELSFFKSAVEELMSSEVSPETWKTVVAEYREAEGSVSGVSRTNRRLQLLRLLSERFPHLNLRNDPKLIELTLADLRQPGQIISSRLPDGRIGPTRIIRREISERLGVLYTLDSQEGFRFTREFFD